MFASFKEYIATVTALLADKPKGQGIANGTGVVLLIDGFVCYVDEGDSIADNTAADESCWDDYTNASEFAILQNPVFITRFTPAQVEVVEHEEPAPYDDREDYARCSD